MEGWNQQKINRFCGQKKIEWTFNPPAASHMGGAWERMTRSLHQILRALFKEQVLSDEVMAEVVNILNSRPLTRKTDSPQDEHPPTHRPFTPPVAMSNRGVLSKDDNNCGYSWRQA